MIDLTQVLTFSEAAEKWGLAGGNTLRKAVERKRFKEDEIRKSGDTWLTTYEAMVRVFGLPRMTHTTISIADMENTISDSLYQPDMVEVGLPSILRTIENAVARSETITVIRSKEHPEEILSIIKNKEDLENFARMMKRYLSSF